ncbi:DUF5081 family protein [Listeria costaricensis]|uniref:DUF5081 family protein n=1 Tax=Listeria costaricensis TaxID=2026604 RepID=UPI000C08D2B2|nr:DUF5081 family protein [Listeria costaricensis]
MMTHARDTFSPAELYLLVAPFDLNHIFGVPDKMIYKLKGSEHFEAAYEELKQKNILTQEDTLTDGGGIVMETLRSYCQSSKYVRLNQLMFAFPKDADNEVIVLAEIKADQEYRIERLNKIYALALIRKLFPIIEREPLEDETSFMQRELTNAERRKALEIDPGKNFISMEFFHLEKEPHETTNHEFYQQYLAFAMDEWLIQTDVMTEDYYRISQYALMKQLFDEMEFPYKEGKI